MPNVEVDSKLLERAAAILREGGLVACPTDTVYGLAADPTNDEAVRRLAETKRRDPNQSIPLLIASEEQLSQIATTGSGAAGGFQQSFWPGGLTIVLPKAPSFRSIAAPGDTIGVRVPDHAVPRELSRLLGGPITGTSANIAGAAEPLSAGAVRDQLGDTVDLIIDGGRCSGDRPSTVLDCTVDPPRILREGAISRADLERVAPIASD